MKTQLVINQQRKKRVFRISVLGLLLVTGIVWILSQGSTALASPTAIVSGVAWPDQHGNNLQCHGGNVIEVGSTYYCVGEDKLGENSSDAYFQHVPCYASTNLATWTYINETLVKQSSGDLGPNRIVERPKVIYNNSTGQYVMYMHIDTPGYGTGKVGVATSSSVCGNYSYRGSFTPLGLQSWDMNLYVDDNGIAYLLTHASDNHLHIDQLSSDYLSVVSSVASISPNYEAPAMMKVNGRYYLFGSNLTGWNTNDNVYTTATSLSGPWSGWTTFAPVGTNTWNSQTMFILPVSGSQGTTYLFMGDRWNPNDLGASTYVWLPLQINGTTVAMNWYSPWYIDVSTGLWSTNGSGGPTPTFIPPTPSSGISTTAWYSIKNQNSSLCIDAKGNGTSNGTVLDQYTCGSGKYNQEWQFQPLAGGYYGIADRNASSELWDVVGGSTSNGGLIDLWTYGSAHQEWQAVSLGNSLYKFVNHNSGLCLDVPAWSTTAGVQFDQWTCNGGANQAFVLIQQP